MEKLKVFEKDEFGKVRVTDIDGKPYFVGKDVAIILGYSNPRDAISRHCKGVVKHDGFKEGGNCISLISEGDVYRLIMKSKLPQAEKFEVWVVDEVLPSIRKHGAYMTEETLEKALTSPDFLIELATKLKEEQEARKIAEAKIEEQKPLVEFAETVANSSDNIDMNELAKLINNENILLNGKKVGRNKLFQWLREKKILMENNLPYQKYIDSGYFNVIETVKQTVYGSQTFRKTLVTGRGQLKIVEMIRRG